MSTSIPLVSVLMPVYNGEAYLKDAINSVLNQTFEDFEFIIINDGSTDDTQRIIDSFSDVRIKSFIQVNQGVAKTLNNGLKLVNGIYLWRHDADDLCLPEQLQTQIDFLKHHTNYALVSTQIAFMSDHGKIAYDFKQPNDTYFKDKNFIKVERSHFNPYSPITHATVLVKKEVFDVVGIYRTEFKTSEDTDLWLRIIEKFDAAVLNFCSYFVRLNSTSATQVYKKTNNFYRELAFQFADERAERGADVLQRDEKMPQYPLEPLNQMIYEKNGKNYRNDLLDFEYKVMLNAKDYKNSFQIIKISLKDGWKLSSTWKALLFPLLSDKILGFGVKFKRLFR